MSSNITFTHNIRPIISVDFSKITSGFEKQNYVNYPWTIAESVIGENVITTNVCDCTACLITDGEKALLMHICPTIKGNRDFKTLFNYICRNIQNMAKDQIQGIMVGSRDTVTSRGVWSNFSEIFKILKIPVTKLRNGKWSTNIAYKRSTDEVFISSYPMDCQIKKGGKSGLELLNSQFKEVSIAEYDEVV